jgi:hypothetical protein
MTERGREPVPEELTRHAISAWPADLADGIEIPTPPEKPVPILPDEEITALPKTCTVPGAARGVRPGDRLVFFRVALRSPDSPRRH